jgi:hypothetical protein
MATKYGTRKKHNAGTARTSTNNRGGSRTRKSVTVKTGNFTRSRSVNRNGTVKLTTTHKSPSGFITRTSKSVGSKPSKIKAPKFIKAKPFKLPKMKLFKPAKNRVSRSTGVSLGGLFSGFSNSRKRSNRETVDYEYEYDGESTPLTWRQWILLLIAAPFIWLFGILWPFIAFGLYYVGIFILLVGLAIVFLLMTG